MRRAFLMLVFVACIAPSSCRGGDAGSPQGPVVVDVPPPGSAALVQFERNGDALTATWPAGGGRIAYLTFALGGGPLFGEIAIAPTAGAAPRVVARGLAPRYEVTTGARGGGGAPYVFFDSPGNGPTNKARATLRLGLVHAEASGARGSVTFSSFDAGGFHGDLRVHFYAESPLVHVEAEMAQPDPGVAYFYDAGIDGPIDRVAYVASPDDDIVVRATPAGDRAPIAVRYRTIAAEWDAGALALFPPPHAFFFPRDLSTNLAYVEAGANAVGIRQAPTGGGIFSPWFDAPAGSVQRMDLFMLVDPGRADDALARVRAYTHDDAFPAVPGRVTFTSHWHSRLTASEEAGTPLAPELVHVMKRLGVNIVHLAEFHYDAHWDDPGTPRFEDQRVLFDLVRRYSDDWLLFIPGEEGMSYVGNPAPGDDNGHFAILFPKPVYFAWHRDAGAPFVDTIAPYGTVYRLGGRDDAVELLAREGALAWTTHPRIKASAHAPDAYRDQPFYTGDAWLGATWKAMPGDLSIPHLGDRSLRLFDDMNTWGQKKQLIGEVDVFEVDRSHEIYGHMNINYLRLATVPSVDDWTPVMKVLRNGDFFTTTGEVLLHDVSWSPTFVRADVSWTLPLDHVNVIWKKAGAIARTSIPVLDATENGRRVMAWDVNLLGAEWVRFEAWDIARDGAFTQQIGP